MVRLELVCDLVEGAADQALVAASWVLPEVVRPGF